MSIRCLKCGRDEARGVVVFNGDGTTREYCNVHRPSRNITPALNPFQNFTLDHVRNERNEKVTVNSLSELRAAEKKFNFALAVASDNDGCADKPPQHCDWAGDISHGKKRVWNRDPAAYVKPSGVSVGNAADPKRDTLIERPNATHI
jgi:hypothetical protein